MKSFVLDAIAEPSGC